MLAFKKKSPEEFIRNGGGCVRMKKKSVCATICLTPFQPTLRDPEHVKKIFVNETLSLCVFGSVF
jgi:hypothetical protein